MRRLRTAPLRIKKLDRLPLVGFSVLPIRLFRGDLPEKIVPFWVALGIYKVCGFLPPCADSPFIIDQRVNIPSLNVADCENVFHSGRTSRPDAMRSSRHFDKGMVVRGTGDRAF